MRKSLPLLALAAVVALGVIGMIAGYVSTDALGGLLLANAPLALDPEKVQAELKRIGDEVKDWGTKALAEISKFGKLSEDTKARVDTALVTQGELQADLRQAQQILAEIKAKGAGAGARPKTLGETIVGSEEFEAFMKSGGLRSAKDTWSHTVNASITSFDASSGDLVREDRVPGIITPPERRLVVRDLITPGTTNSNAIQYVKETGFTNNAATVSETVQKPESDLTFELTNSPVVTIAHWVKASRQIIADAPMLRSYIDGRLRYGLRYVEEGQLLNGSGVGNNLNGIYTQATAYSAPIDPPGTETVIDVIRLMLLQAELAEFPATGIVLHPSDWAKIELTKDSTGAYIFANPQAMATPQLWGRPVVATQAMTVDTALVGAFRLGAQIFQREEISVVMATENQDDFIKNMVTILCEERLALATYRPEAFIKNANLP